MKLSYEELEVLVKRNYPDYPDLKPNGYCSNPHRNEKGEFIIDIRCPVCFPSWNELAQVHCDLKCKAWEQLTRLGEKIDYGY